jgi:hypothetical protein
LTETDTYGVSKRFESARGSCGSRCAEIVRAKSFLRAKCSCSQLISGAARSRREKRVRERERERERDREREKRGQRKRADEKSR